jgi:hypothetical protein
MFVSATGVRFASAAYYTYRQSAKLRAICDNLWERMDSSPTIPVKGLKME